MAVDADVALDTRVAELLRRSDAESKMAEQLKSQGRQQYASATFGKLQGAIAEHTARANQLRGDAMSILASRKAR
jgi:hypothetical protein